MDQYGLILGALALLGGAVLLMVKKKDYGMENVTLGRESSSEREVAKRSSVPGGDIKRDQLLPGEVRLRFNPSKHPFSSVDAAEAYYAKYRSLLFPDAADSRLRDAEVLASLRSGKNLHLAIGQVGELEIVDAVPYLLKFLSKSEDPSIQRLSARLLAQFGKPEGYEFFLENYGSSKLSPNQLLFEIVTFYGREEYVPRIREMLTQEMEKGAWHGRSLARILAFFGDDAALDFYLPKLKGKPDFDDVDMALIANIQSEELVAPLTRQHQESRQTGAKLAAAYALTKQGELEYQDEIIDTALLGINMPNAREHPVQFQSWSVQNGGENGSGISGAMGYLPEIKTVESVRALEEIAATENAYSIEAIIGLAKMETRESRDALLRLTEEVRGTSRQNYLAKALALYADEEAAAAASSLFDSEKVKNLSFFLAETKGSAGLFDERIKRW